MRSLKELLDWNPYGQCELVKCGRQRLTPATLGPVLGPVIGGAIIDGISWRWIFYVNVPVGIVALLTAWR